MLREVFSDGNQTSGGRDEFALAQVERLRVLRLVQDAPSPRGSAPAEKGKHVGWHYVVEVWGRAKES
ncbi:MAG: hypothetical protein ACXWC8_18315, partial [Limisphaerales bacterium]